MADDAPKSPVKATANQLLGTTKEFIEHYLYREDPKSPGKSIGSPSIESVKTNQSQSTAPSSVSTVVERDSKSMIPQEAAVGGDSFDQMLKDARVEWSTSPFVAVGAGCTPPPKTNATTPSTPDLQALTLASRSRSPSRSSSVEKIVPLIPPKHTNLIKTAETQLLQFLRLDYQIRVQKEQLKRLEMERKQMQQNVTDSCRELRMTKVDLNLNNLSPQTLAEIGGPGSIELKVRKRVRVGGGGVASTDGGSGSSGKAPTTETDSVLKQALMFRLRRQKDPHPEQTLKEWVEEYEHQQEFEPVTIEVLRQYPQQKRLKVFQASSQSVPYEKN